MKPYLGWLVSLAFLLGLGISTLMAEPPPARPKVEVVLDQETADRLADAMQAAKSRNGFERIILDELTAKQVMGAIQGSVSFAEDEADRKARLINKRIVRTVRPTPRPGDTVVLSGLPSELHGAVKAAFIAGTRDPDSIDVTVKLETSVAYQLLYVLTADFSTNFTRARD